MKNSRFLSIIIALLALVIASGCSNSEAKNEFQEQEDRISALISADSINITEEAGLYNLSVTYSYRNVASFGNYVLSVQSAFEEVFEEPNRGSFRVNMIVNFENPSTICYNSDNYANGGSGLCGYISDTRSGEVVLTNINGIDDLIKEFPATEIYARDLGILPDDDRENDVTPEEDVQDHTDEGPTDDTSEIELTGNPFLDAEKEIHFSEGGGVTLTIKMNKAEALSASLEEYVQFLEDRLARADELKYELFGIIFEDGTGITYYGCDSINAVYGGISQKGYPMSNGGFGDGAIIPNEDGTYSYMPFTDE